MPRVVHCCAIRDETQRVKYTARIIGEPDIALNEDKMHPVAHRPRSTAMCLDRHNEPAHTFRSPPFVSESLLLVRGYNFVKFGLIEHAQDKVDEEGRQKITPEGMKHLAHIHHRSRAVTHSRFWFMMTTVTSAARRSLRAVTKMENRWVRRMSTQYVVQPGATYKKQTYAAVPPSSTFQLNSASVSYSNSVICVSFREDSHQQIVSGGRVSQKHSQLRGKAPPRASLFPGPVARAAHA